MVSTKYHYIRSDFDLYFVYRVLNLKETTDKLDTIPSDVPTRIAVGVASPSAHGQETTWNETYSYNL